MAEMKRKSPWDPPASDPPAVAAVAPPPAETSPAAVSVRRINFDVPVDLHRRVRVKALSEGVTIAELGRDFFERWVNDAP